MLQSIPTGRWTLIAAAAAVASLPAAASAAPRALPTSAAPALPAECVTDAFYRVTCTWTTPGDYTLQLPPVASDFEVTAIGGSGGGAAGGKGAQVDASAGQAFGQLLNITVGSDGSSPGGTAGGGAPGAGGAPGGGGGSSRVDGMPAPPYPWDSVVVAAGGGGQGSGGVAGGNAGSAGATGPAAGDGGGGSPGSITLKVNGTGGAAGTGGPYTPASCDDGAGGGTGTVGQSSASNSSNPGGRGGAGGPGGLLTPMQGGGGGGGGGGFGGGGGGGGGELCGVVPPVGPIHWIRHPGGGGGGGSSYVNPNARFEYSRISDKGSAPGGTAEVVISFRIPAPDGCLAPDTNGLVTCAWSTPGSYQLQVPAGATNLTVTAAGAQGGSTPPSNGVLHTGAYGGRGAGVSANFGASLSGSSQAVQVGGMGGNGFGGSSLGGTGGGGNGGNSPGSRNAAGGGGASSLGALLIAAGGGGAGWEIDSAGLSGDGGNAGSSGVTGVTSGCGIAGGGGFYSASPPAQGGAGGSGDGHGGAGGSGQALTGGTGGFGGEFSPADAGAGGGGGGGATGGGGGGGGGVCAPPNGNSGGGGGGAGGSSFVDPSASSPVITAGGAAPNFENGWVVVTYTVAPTVTGYSAPPLLRKSPFSVAFDLPAAGVTAADLTVIAHDLSPVPGTLACTDAGSAPVSCSTGPVSTAFLTPSQPLLAGGEYTIGVNTSATGVTGYPAGPAVGPWSAQVRAQTDFSYSQYPLKYKWGLVKNATALGGSYVQERELGATEKFSFTGTTLGVVLWSGPAQGIATVKVTSKGNPAQKQTVDTYAPATADTTVSFSSLPAGKHTVLVTVKGTHNPAATDTDVGLDAFVVNGVTTSTPTTTATWSDGPGYGYAFSRQKGATLSMAAAYAAGFAWQVVIGPTGGEADVYIDGSLVTTEDLYAPGYSNPSFVYSLPLGVHSIKIVLTGTSNPASSDTVVRSRGITVL